MTPLSPPRGQTDTPTLVHCEQPQLPTQQQGVKAGPGLWPFPPTSFMHSSTGLSAGVQDKSDGTGPEGRSVTGGQEAVSGAHSPAKGWEGQI